MNHEKRSDRPNAKVYALVAALKSKECVTVRELSDASGFGAQVVGRNLRSMLDHKLIEFAGYGEIFGQSDHGGVSPSKWRWVR
jgi:predicted transcriptional regulator